MDNIPIELTSLIAQHLLQWTPYESFFQRSSPLKTPIYRTDVWWICKTQTVQDICNFRLVDRKCYNSSPSVFGDLLGHRVFRFTKVGLEDLQAIANTPTVRPHIRMLTFGNAQFHDVHRPSRLRDALALVSEPDRTRLRNAYDDAFQWHRRYNLDDYRSEMIELLGKLSNVTNLRLRHYHDYPNEHLGGWLGPGDVELIRHAQKSLSKFYLTEAYLYERSWGQITWFAVIMEAIKGAGIAIKDFQLGQEGAILPSGLVRLLDTTSTGMTSRLRHICFEIDPDSLERGSVQNFGHTYRSVLGSLPSITSLTLIMPPFSAFMSDFATATTNLLATLMSIAGLEQITIRGEWNYSEDQLVDLVSKHSQSLKQLVLRGVILADGGWTSLVTRVAFLPLPHMEHFQLFGLSIQDSKTRITPAYEHEDAWLDFVASVRPAIEDCAKYTVFLSSGNHKYIHQPHAK